MTDDMIPRIVVRDNADAELLFDALKLYLEARIAEEKRDARLPGANQWALSMNLIEETRNLCDLIDTIGKNIIEEPNTEEKEDDQH
jgi:hypothetical protein